MIEKIALNPKYKEAVEGSVVIVTNATAVNKYEDGKRTDQIDGYRVNGTIISGELAGSEISLKTARDPQVETGAKVKFSIDEWKVYALTKVNSGFASVEVSLRGSVAVADQKGEK